MRGRKEIVEQQSEAEGWSSLIGEPTYTGRVGVAAGRDGVDMRCGQECPLVRFETHIILTLVTVKGDSKSRNLIFGIKSS